MLPLKRIIPLLLLLTTFFQALDLKARNDSLLWIEWISPGLQAARPPAFANLPDLNEKSFQAKDLFLPNNPRQETWPHAGMHTPGFNGSEYEWEIKRAERDGYVKIGPVIDQQDFYARGEAVSYLYTPRYTRIRIVIKSLANLQLSHNGSVIASTEMKAGKESKIEKTLELERGKHYFHLKAVLDKDDSGPWSFTAYLQNDSLPGQLYLGSDNSRFMDMDLLMNGEQVGNLRPSFDGQYLLASYYRTEPPKGAREVWYEIIERESGNCVQQLRGMKMNSLSWNPASHQLGFIRTGKDLGEVWVMQIPGGQQKMIAEIEKLSSIHWGPDGKTMICSIREEAPKEKNGVRRYLHMPDRQSHWRNRSFLIQLDIESGTYRRLSWGHLSTYLQDIHPDGKEILFSTSTPDFTERPYTLNTLYRLNLATMKADSIWTTRHSFSVSYSPDGKLWLVSGSPALFGTKGINVPKGRIPNDYDTQLFLYTPESGNTAAITRNFDPKVLSSQWNSLDGNIYLLAEEGTYKRLFVYKTNTKEFERLSQEPEVIRHWDLSRDGRWLTYTGTSIAKPESAFLMDTKSRTPRLIADPEAERFERVKFGMHQEWPYIHKGTKIDGRIYFPPDFDKNKQYPVIVYYYGGTNPTDRSFRGRYPKNLFAAMGYIVYVLQPSGATGYGQEFSSRHVNNWGKTVADEIIGATKAFLKAHPFADPKRVGCIGASYGGFMTMLLSTRTDIFSAAISHAGISSISSYWGEGLWGYAYSSTATADRFPWNDREIYVDQSPLFNADKIQTPLLLLHGEDDTNVPRGESLQLFTALKLLGRPVEYIGIEGQDHHILDYEKRILWQKSILAWFDYWLKGEKEWWNDLYPDKSL